MGVEMHQRHLAEMFGISAQQRQGNVMVATEREQPFARRQQPFSMGLQFFAHLASVAKGVDQVAAVHYPQPFAHIKPPGKAVMLPGQVGGNLANRTRPQTTAGAARGRHIKRNTGDDPFGVAIPGFKVQRQAEKTEGVRDKRVVVLMSQRAHKATSW